ncbi:MAG: branched-chain amino acid ABC transporter permease [Deltaproteobacteria bacterium]|nr:MAG: branched-chain amino acid ABC transporter permease [Deltaproteobacteria bacterium]
MLNTIALSLVNGVVWGCILAMVSVGLTLIYGQLEIINIAHGAMYAIGAVTAFYVSTLLGSWAYSLLISPLVMAAIAMAIYGSSLRYRIVGYPVAVTLIISYGFMFILEQLTLLIFGGAPRCIPNPLPYEVGLFGGKYPIYRIFAAAFSLAVIGALLAFLGKTKLGLWIRATNQDHDTASAMGVPVPTVYMFTFILGSILAALGGTLVAPMTSITHNMGAEIIIDSFIVVIVAGFGSIPGTIVAALILSLTTGFFSVIMDPVLAKGISLAVMIGILYLKPEGIMRY